MSVEVAENDRTRTYFVLATRYLIWNLLTFVICLVCNSSQGKFSKYKISDVGDIYRSAFSPAGFAFSIWGLIYLGLTAFLCYHIATVVALFRQRQLHQDTAKNNHFAQASRLLIAARIIVDEIGVWFGVANLLNASWIPVFVQATDLAIGIAAVILIGLVLSLSRIQLSVHHWWRKLEVRAPALPIQDEKSQMQTNASTPSVVNILSPRPGLGHKMEISDDDTTTNQKDGDGSICTHRNNDPSMVVPGWELFLIDFPFSIYLGWTTCAATLNVTMWFENIPLKGIEKSLLPLMIVLIALVIAFLIFGVLYIWRARNFAAGLVFTWATVAIWVGTLESGECDQAPNFDEGKCKVVGISALTLGCLIGLLSILQLVRFILKIRARDENTCGALV